MSTRKLNPFLLPACLALAAWLSLVSGVIGQEKNKPGERGVRPKDHDEKRDAQVKEDKEKNDRNDAQAREAAERFMAAVMKAQVDKVMKQVEVPFYKGNGGGEAQNQGEIVKARDQLAKTLVPGQPDKSVFKFGALTSFGSLPENTFEARDYDLLDGIAKNSDRIVFFNFLDAYDAERVAIVVVRVKDNKTKVIGFARRLSVLSLLLVKQANEWAAISRSKDAEIARKTTGKFLKAIHTSDLDGLLALTDVPWCADGPILEKREELKKYLKYLVDKSAFADFSAKNVVVVTNCKALSELMAGAKSNLLPKEVTTNDDWVVVLVIARHAAIFSVHIRAGKAKVIGVMT